MAGLKIYLTTGGANIAAQEIREESGKRIVKGASYFEMHPSHVRFNFSAIKYFEPSGEMKLNDAGILGEQDMPPMIAERFKLYLKQLETEAEQLKKEIEAAKAAQDSE